MLRPFFPRALTAMLCIALSLVFAGAATATVGDNIQHQLEPDHASAHGPLSMAVADHDHDHDHHHDGDDREGASDEGQSQGHGPTHHHHGDNAFASALDVSSVTLAAGPSRLASPRRDHLISGPAPGAPERPPKTHGLRT